MYIKYVNNFLYKNRETQYKQRNFQTGTQTAKDIYKK